MFRDRQEAGRKLASALDHYRGQPCLIVALPRGGLPVGLEIARALRAPLDFVLVRKIGAPWQPELALGAVVDGDFPELVLNDDVARLIEDDTYLEREKARQLAEISRRRALYGAARPRVSPAGRVAIVVDDGIATGATMRAALRALRHAGPRWLVLAVPVAPAETLAELSGEADEIVCLETPDDFLAIGDYYTRFPQLTDEETIAILDRAAEFSAELHRPPQKPS